MSIREWLRKRRSAREAQRLVASIFADAEFLKGTSLRRRHASRWVLLDHATEAGRVVRVRFGILRHPRPYAFSNQSHKVIEHYELDVANRKLHRLRGHNLTREKGADSD